jgi:hypothetical protein
MFDKSDLFMQNKANFGKNKMCANLFTIRDYEENGHSGHQKTKPIQTQFKANKANNKPNLSQFKAKTNPISNV